LIEAKNPGQVVQAIDRLQTDEPDIQCHLIGDGPEYDRVASIVESRGLESNVHLPGFLDDYNDVIAYMAAADAFVLPSRREGFGITALEALAAGTPTVTVDYPKNGTRELVAEGKTGCVTDPTPAALVAGIRRARSEVDPDACVRSARIYDWDRIAKRAERSYRDALEGTLTSDGYGSLHDCEETLRRDALEDD
jgi:glycosyltransferase involved in cell wall biosynthesis